MLIQGEKWACDACVRGHRVSSCQHRDRPLTHINKKGRPVSQCQHCRGLRKARTTHVKCDCGGKVHGPADCHLAERAVDDDGGQLDGDYVFNSVSTLTSLGTRKQCCCSHTARCTCAGKKDSDLARVPEPDLPRSPPSTGRKRPRPTSAMSESILTGVPFRPHKNKNGDPRRSQPYPIPRSLTVHGSSVLARRSADHLPLGNDVTQQNVTPYQDSVANTPPPLRRAKSENGSPKNQPVLMLGDASSEVYPLDVSISPLSVTAVPLAGFDCEGFSPDSYCPSGISPLLDAGNIEESSVDWSTFDLSAGTSDFAAEYSQPASYASFDCNSFNYRGLTMSSSDNVSEVGEFGSVPIINLPKPDAYDMGSLSDSPETETYRLSAPSSYLGPPTVQILSPENLDPLDLETLLKPAAPSPMVLPRRQLAITADAGPYPVPQNLPIQPEQGFTPIGYDISPQSQGLSVTPPSSEPLWLTTALGYTASPVSTCESPILQFDPWSREHLLLARGELSPAC